MPTKIEWCDETINPVVGCSKVSEACANNQCDGCDALRTELSKWESGQKLFMGDDFGDNIPAVMEALRAENAALKARIENGIYHALLVERKAHEQTKAELAKARSESVIKEGSDLPEPEVVKARLTRGDSDLITVCDKCLQASCWQGAFMCDKSRNAGTVQKTRGELAKLGLESSHYWKTDEELSHV